MKVSLKWLSDFVSFSMPLDKMVERLTMAGLEVSDRQIVGGEWDNVVVGKIVKVEPHPNADRLRLVTVDLGKERSTVVCGAPNLVVGDKIAFAYPGARLMNEDGKLAELKPAKIRGILSTGMICSERELGISDRHEGIMVLSVDAPVAASLNDYLGDIVLDIDVTPNRPDCLSVIGIAREVAAVTGGKLHIPEISYNEIGGAIRGSVSVEILAPELCPRYCASLLTNIEIGPSPQWLQQRLLASGMRPINNVVDVTNYVMLEYGQPLHAFDYDKIHGQKIIVRCAERGDSIATLDGTERVLSGDLLVIADNERAIAVAGIMGGLDSEVMDDTVNVLIESANFDQAVIHRGSIKLKLSSEASLRFEKGLSRELPLLALKRATQLMQQLAGGKVAKGIIDVYPGKQHQEPMLFSASEVKRLLGIELSVVEIVKTLGFLGFIAEHVEETSQLSVSIPWWRTDISCQADLVEEVARIIGYDNIPITMLSGCLPEYEVAPETTLRRKVKDTLVSCGFQEVITYSLTSLETMGKVLLEYGREEPVPLRIANPMSRGHEYLRTTLRAGVLSTLGRNERYQESGIRLFEVGKIFLPKPKDLPDEKEMLCAVLNDKQPNISWRGETEPVDFFIAKGIAETLLSQLGLEAEFEPGVDGGLYPGRSAIITVAKDKIGVVGELHPKVSKSFDIIGSAYLIEIDLEKMLTLVSSVKQYQPIPRYPTTTRDIALMVDEQVTYKQIFDVVNDSPLVSQVSLFDVYSGEQVTKGKKSFAFRVVYQSPARTLTDEEVDKVQQQILDKLKQQVGATLRA